MQTVFVIDELGAFRFVSAGTEQLITLQFLSKQNFKKEEEGGNGCMCVSESILGISRIPIPADTNKRRRSITGCD